jgi:hypothetical protein
VPDDLAPKRLVRGGVVAVFAAVTLAACPFMLFCHPIQSVRFRSHEGLRVIEASTDTRRHRLPWSFGPVPERWELVPARYRIQFSTPGRENLFVDSATTLDGDEVFIDEGPRIGENRNAGIRYYIYAGNPWPNQIVLTVRNKGGNVLGAHAMSYRIVSHSYYCTGVEF